ncbi:hypothetical protein [Pedobacter sp. BMA]|uniref:hypothetical protein n=1 Tax=Pedobacter sp. BMA TaxID=1663685 RepID=UPI000649736A|nr:hypothetical protein [Pedobacter sp. BMA]KLT66882.1 hypothetical protein AB669_02855 [Pedobacter sp. BMA]
MKRILILAIAISALIHSGCNTDPDSNAIKKEVLNIHDKLMMDGEKVVKNRIKLDSVLKSDQLNSLSDAKRITLLITRLNAADENMMDWMHFFKDDFKGKSEQEALAYYKSEMLKIRAVEDEYIRIIRESDSVLKAHHVSPSAKMEHHKN